MILYSTKFEGGRACTLVSPVSLFSQAGGRVKCFCAEGRAIQRYEDIDTVSIGGTVEPYKLRIGHVYTHSLTFALLLCCRLLLDLCVLGCESVSWEEQRSGERVRMKEQDRGRQGRQMDE